MRIDRTRRESALQHALFMNLLTRLVSGGITLDRSTEDCVRDCGYCGVVASLPSREPGREHECPLVSLHEQVHAATRVVLEFLRTRKRPPSGLVPGLARASEALYAAIEGGSHGNLPLQGAVGCSGSDAR